MNETERKERYKNMEELDNSLGMSALTSTPQSELEAKENKEPESPKDVRLPGAKKTFLTRGNLIAIGLMMVFSFLMIFVGFCIPAIKEGETAFISPKNPFALLRKSMGLTDVYANNVAAQATNILVAVYLSLFVFAFIFEYRYAIIKHKKWYAPKQWLIYVGTLLLCAVLSYGLGIVIQDPLTGEAVANVSLFLGETLLITFLTYALFALLIGAVLLIVVNFVKFSKPLSVGDSLEEEVNPAEDVAAGFGEGAAGFSPAAANIENGELGEGASAGAGALNGKLEDREIVFPALSKIDKHYEGQEVEGLEGDAITLPELATRFRNYLADKEKLYYELDTLRFFLSGLAASHLEILEGLSGTGKSSLPRSFAKFVNGYSVFLPVQATWRDKTSLIGYFNDFSKTYRETDFLLNLYEAAYNPDRIYLFVLDEMNISRVEYYFADFLSVLEYPQEQWKVRVMQLPYDFVPPIKLTDGFVQIPPNAYFVGTANQDDSTFSIADKVYDRAITIAFDNRNIAFPVEGESDPIFLTAGQFQSMLDEARNEPKNAFTANDLKKLNVITDYVYDEFGVAFGNRILNQIEIMVPTFIGFGGKKEDVLDFILSRKVLAKLEGRFEDNVRPGLEHILALLEETYGAGAFHRCEKQIENMLKRL